MPGPSNEASSGKKNKAICPPVLESDAIASATSRMVAAAKKADDQSFEAQEKAILDEVGKTLQTMIETLNGTKSVGEGELAAGALNPGGEVISTTEGSAAASASPHAGGAAVWNMERAEGAAARAAKAKAAVARRL